MQIRKCFFIAFIFFLFVIMSFSNPIAHKVLAQSIHTEDVLRAANEKLIRAESLVSLGHWELDLTTNILSLSDNATRILGVSDIFLTKEELEEMLLPESREIRLQAHDLLLAEGKPYNVELQIKRASDGVIRDLHSTGTYDPVENTLFGTLLDITDRKMLERSIVTAKKRDMYLGITLLLMQTVVIVSLVSNIRQRKRAQAYIERSSGKNQQFLSVLHQQTESVEELLQSYLNVAVSLTDSGGGCIHLYDQEQGQFTTGVCFSCVQKHFLCEQEKVFAKIVEQKSSILENKFYRHGVTRYLFVPVIENNQVVVIVGLINKESDYQIDDLNQISLLMTSAWHMIARKQNGLLLEYLSYHDLLTGLPNRRFLLEQMERMEKERVLPCTLVVGDVNELKLVNDAFGYQVGDELLKYVATILQVHCGPDDVVGRWAGDEFVIMLPNASARDGKLFIERLKQVFIGQKFYSIFVSLSLGYCTKTAEAEGIEEIFNKAERMMYQAKLTHSPRVKSETVQALMGVLYEKSKREEEHSQRVSQLCANIAKEFGLSEQESLEIQLAGLFHDLGKISIEGEILNKAGSLTPEEWLEMKNHPESGYRILKSVTGMEAIAEAVLGHHERWNGSGYPRGLKGEQIPFMSRIIAVADAYDAMVSIRPYRRPLSSKEALEELKKCAGTDFDPNIVDVFIKIIVQELGQNYA